MELSRNFTLSELIKSDTAIRKGINNNPNAEQIEKLKALCENILQPVRDHFGRVKVTSGFRSVDLCLAINSSTVAIQKVCQENNFYMRLEKMARHNTNL